MRQERNRKIVITLKKEYMQRHNGRLPCKICTFDFIEAYGSIGAGFAEAHHITSLSEAPKAGRTVSIRDFALVCSNCHSMLHRGPDFPSIEALQKRVRHATR
jgi:predicted HNH restriction endonuclease